MCCPIRTDLVAGGSSSFKVSARINFGLLTEVFGELLGKTQIIGSRLLALAVAIDLIANHLDLILEWKGIKMSDSRFPKSVRLRRQSEFDRVYGGDVFAADNVLVIKAVRNDLAVSRMGLSISRKVGNAVVRNRWKRRIREAFRNHQATLPAGIDFVVRPKKGAECNYAAIERSIPRLLQRIEKNLNVL